MNDDKNPAPGTDPGLPGPVARAFAEWRALGGRIEPDYEFPVCGADGASDTMRSLERRHVLGVCIAQMPAFDTEDARAVLEWILADTGQGADLANPLHRQALLSLRAWFTMRARSTLVDVARRWAGEHEHEGNLQHAAAELITRQEVAELSDLELDALIAVFNTVQEQVEAATLERVRRSRLRAVQG